jgi:hypothetical protein
MPYGPYGYGMTMATRKTEECAPEGAIDGPEFIELCEDCNRKLRKMSAAKARFATIAGHDGMIGNLFVPIEGDVPLVLDVVDVELEETVGMAYLESRGA